MKCMKALSKALHIKHPVDVHFNYASKEPQKNAIVQSPETSSADIIKSLVMSGKEG